MYGTNDRYEFVRLEGGGATSAAPPALARVHGDGLSRVASTVLPLAMIAGLLYAGLFIKPAPSGLALPTPPLERRDAFWGLAVPAPGVIWAAGSRGKIVRSDDGGRQWQRQATPTAEPLQDLAAWDDRRAVAVGNQGVVLRTEDGGGHWQAVAAPRSEVANKLQRVLVLGGGRAIAVGEMGALLGSEDFGRSWRRLASERDVGLNAVAAMGEQLWVVGEGGLILHSADGGSSWQTQPVPVARSLTGVAFRDARHGVAVGLDGLILSTDNGGLVWNDRSLKGLGHLYDVSAEPEGWRAVGERDVLVRADADARDWRVGRATGSSLAWHTKIAGGQPQWLYAGPATSLLAQTRGAAGAPLAGDRP